MSWAARLASALAWADRPFLGNPLWAWLAAAATAGAVFTILLAARRLVVRRWGGGATPSASIPAQLAARTHAAFLLALALLAATPFLQLDTRADLLRRALFAATLVQSGLWGNALLGALAAGWATRHGAGGPPPAFSIAGALLRIALWSVVCLLVLDNLGVRITALLAGVGIGGIAVALALQNILGDIFASVSILLDRPFEVGDFIILGDVLGTVERIGLKTTRIRSLSGEQIVLPNADLLGGRIRNYKRMSERRVVLSLGVTYETPVEKIESLPGILKSLVLSAGGDRVRFDRAHFQKFGDFALVFEVVYYVLDADYNVYMDVQQALNLAICRRFAQEHVEFAYPTQKLYLSLPVVAGPP